MKLSEDIKPVTYLKTRAAEVLKTVRRTGRPMVITQHGEAQAVVMDVDAYEKLKAGLMMLQLLSESESEIQQGKGIPLDEAMQQVKRKLRQK